MFGSQRGFHQAHSVGISALDSTSLAALAIPPTPEKTAAAAAAAATAAAAAAAAADEHGVVDGVVPPGGGLVTQMSQVLGKGRKARAQGFAEWSGGTDGDDAEPDVEGFKGARGSGFGINSQTTAAVAGDSQGAAAGGVVRKLAMQLAGVKGGTGGPCGTAAAAAGDGDGEAAENVAVEGPGSAGGVGLL
jgi:hypothetical protein